MSNNSEQTLLFGEISSEDITYCVSSSNFNVLSNQIILLLQLIIVLEGGPFYGQKKIFFCLFWLVVTSVTFSSNLRNLKKIQKSEKIQVRKSKKKQKKTIIIQKYPKKS